VVLFPNWTDVNSFFPIADKTSLKRKFSYQPTDRIILYSGAIGEKQGLDSIIKIADELRELKDVKFIICGSGPYKKDLQALADDRKLENLEFMPLQSFDAFNDFLNLADIHLVIQKAGATDLVMPSKLTTILAVGGLAIITANEGTGLHSLVQDNNIGVLTATENHNALKDCIVRVLNSDLRYINANARRYAVERLSTEKILSSYEASIQSGRLAYELSPKFGSRRGRDVATLHPNLPRVRDSKAG
jgi:colanic acid biosynthesis glycosyl transferase WcaI